MLKKITFVLTVFLFAASVYAAGAATTTVEVQKGEKWWGLTFDALAGGGLNQGQPFEAPFEITEKNIDRVVTPVLLSNIGRYVFAPDMTGIKFDGQKFEITTASEIAKVEKGGKTLREAHVVCALKNFTPGAVAPDADLFALPLYRTRVELGFAQDEAAVLEYARKLLDEGFPAGIIVICDGWQNINGSYEFEPDLYPDPKRMVDRLHALGFKVMLTVSPYVPAWGKVYGEANRDEQLAMRSLSIPYGIQGGLLDMTNEKQFERIRTGLEKIKAEIGFDGFLFDYYIQVAPEFNEAMLSLRGDATLAVYPNLGASTYTPYAVSKSFGNVYGINLFAQIIGNAVVRGLLGQPYMLSEVDMNTIGRESQNMAAYLMLQCGMPVVNVAFAPWRITDPQLYQGVKDALNFRASIGEYMRQTASESARMGTPIVRHLEYQFPKQGFADCDDQFMLGSKYMIAPCVDGAPKRLVRLPKGTWTDNKGARIKGPVVMEAECSQGLVWYESAK